MSLLFTPNKLGPHQLDNRIIVAPMANILRKMEYPHLGIQCTMGN